MSKELGHDYIEIDNDKITGLEPGKKYILSAELVASVDTTSDHEYTVKVEAESAYSEETSQIEKHIFEFRIDGTKEHRVSKSITWMAQGSEDLRELRLFLTTTEEQGLPGVKFAIANIFCVEQGGSTGGIDGDGPVYWIGNGSASDAKRIEDDASKVTLALSRSPDFGGRSIRAVSETELSLDSGIYQVNAVIDVRLEDALDTIADLEVDFGDGFIKCNTITPRIESGKYYSASFSFMKHIATDGTLMSVQLKAGVGDDSIAEAFIKHLGVAKISGGGGSGSSDPTEMQWFRGSSPLGNNIDLPTANRETSAELVMANLYKNAINGGTMEVDNGTVVLTDDKIYEWYALVEVSKDGLAVNTVADIMVTVTGDTGMPHVFYAKMPINEDNIIDVPLSGIARGRGNLQFKFNVAVKDSDSEITAEACNFHFNVKYVEVVAK